MTNAEARFNNSLRPRKPEGSLGWTAQDGHVDSHTAPELCSSSLNTVLFLNVCDVKEMQVCELLTDITEPVISVCH